MMVRRHMFAREDDGVRHQNCGDIYCMCTSKVGLKKENLQLRRGIGLRTLDDGFKDSELKRDWRKPANGRVHKWKY